VTALRFVREILRRAGVHAWLTPPRGADLFTDLRNDLPELNVRTVFDVGANVGQSTIQYLAEFPMATIHAFEPMPSTFADLTRNVGNDRRVKLHQLALSSATGELMMDPTDDSCTALISERGTIRVKVETLDNIVPTDRINFLKVDAEGHDLKVLEGAVRLLDDRRIDVAQIEVGLSPRHSLHVRFEEVKAFMEAKGMELFCLIDQFPNFVPGAPYLQRADAVFISDELVKASLRR
jgi:FkbM family methyltransferase